MAPSMLCESRRQRVSLAAERLRSLKHLSGEVNQPLKRFDGCPGFGTNGLGTTQTEASPTHLMRGLS